MENSKFNLWRATFSFCFVDGFLSQEESNYIEEKVKALPFSPEQKKILMGDLMAPPGINQLLPLITSPADRGFLINNIRLLSRIDTLSPDEKVKIETLTQEVLSKINLAGLTKDAEAAEIQSYHEDEVFAVANKNLYSERLIMKLMKLMNPGDYKFPKE
ncbi:MAG: hypothetical protein V4598_07825 [Bdellovibrionota bacterium]